MNSTQPRQSLTAPADSRVLTRRRFLTAAAATGASSLLLPVISGISLAAQPTLQETFDWLSGKINESAGFEANFSHEPDRRMSNLAFHRDTIEYSQCSFEKNIMKYSSNWLMYENFHNAVDVDVMGNRTRSDTRCRLEKASVTVGLSLFNSNVHVKAWSVFKIAKLSALEDRFKAAPITDVFSVELSVRNAQRTPMGKRGSKWGIKEDLEVEMHDYSAINLVIHFVEEDLAQRVAKAFSHAIKLSGGKAEAF